MRRRDRILRMQHWTEDSARYAGAGASWRCSREAARAGPRRAALPQSRTFELEGRRS
jgi:hypothetical protein